MPVRVALSRGPGIVQCAAERPVVPPPNRRRITVLLSAHQPSPSITAGQKNTSRGADQATGRVAWSTRNVLRQKQLRPKRSLGQNFLQREEVLQAITEVAQIHPGDRVLEIGPGTGNLTRYLLQAGATVEAVEKDDALYATLKATFAAELENGSLRLIHGDFLAQQSDALLGSQDGSSTAARAAGQPNCSAGAVNRLPKVVANLPYNVTKSILQRLLPLGHLFSDLYLMLQDEVAQRLVAGPGTGLEYRAMNLEVSFYSHPTYLFKVDRTAYIPEPNVDGAIVRFQLRPRQQWPLQEDARFLAMVRLAFSERRKMVRNTLHSSFSSETVASALAAAGLPLTSRPQQLDLDQYVALWNQLQQQTADQPEHHA